MMSATFSNISKNDWLIKIQKDLKNYNLEDLKFMINDSLHVSPFAHYEDIQHFNPVNIDSPKANNSWEIIESFSDECTIENNKIILQALQNGTNALKIKFEKEYGIPALSILFENINPEFISIHLSGNLSSIENLLQYFISKNHALDKIIGSIDNINFSKIPKSFKKFRHNVRIYLESDPVVELSQFLFKYYTIFSDYSNEVVSLNNFSKISQIEIKIGSNYLLNIAKIRAYRILYNLLQESFSLESAPIKILVNNSFETNNLTVEENYILATTHLVSSILGTSDGIELIIPLMGKIKNENNSRILRNLHHLATMESNLDKVIDPLKGSYFIEKLTNQIAEAAWNSFHSRIRN